jgi:hypothetical protein
VIAVEASEPSAESRPAPPTQEEHRAKQGERNSDEQNMPQYAARVLEDVPGVRDSIDYLVAWALERHRLRVLRGVGIPLGHEPPLAINARDLHNSVKYRWAAAGCSPGDDVAHRKVQGVR